MAYVPISNGEWSHAKHLSAPEKQFSESSTQRGGGAEDAPALKVRISRGFSGKIRKAFSVVNLAAQNLCHEVALDAVSARTRWIIICSNALLCVFALHRAADFVMRSTCLLSIWLVAAIASTLSAREWADTTGRFKIDAEYFAANEDTVVLKKRNGSLIGLQIAQLSTADQQFLDEKKKALAAEAASPEKSLDQFQTWTSKSGFEIRGRIVAFGRREVTIRRVAGIVNVNGTAYSRLNTFYQQIIPRIVAQFSDPSVQTIADVERWLRGQSGNPAPFTIEGVLMKLEDGSELAVPFFLFSDKDLAILNPGWEQWKAEQASDDDRKREDFLMSVQADSYQRQREADAASHQIQMMQLEMLAVNAGVISIWEVLLRPRPGVYGRETSVMVPAQNSLQAEQLAMQRYPGFVTAGVRRASN
jgi:hypothetical protein